MEMDELKNLSRRWFEDGFGANDASVLEELMPFEMLQESS